MTPIASYEASQIHDKRRFNLYKDAIHAKGTTLKGEFETTIPLADIALRTSRLWAYSFWVQIGIWILLTGPIGVMGIVAFAMMQNSRAVRSRHLRTLA